MSFLYPRTVSVRRQNIPPLTGGTQAYGGVQPVNETIIAQGVTAAVQQDRLGRFTPAHLPESSGLPIYRILIPAASLPMGNAPGGTIQKNDIIVDDLGVRYQVHTPYWTPLGWQVKAELLQD